MNVLAAPLGLTPVGPGPRQTVISGEEGPPAAAGALAKDDTPRPAAAPDDLVGKVAKLAGRLRLAEQAQVREALTRGGLTLALMEVLSARAEAEAQRRSLALAAYRRAAEQQVLAPSRRSPRVDRALVRLRPAGQALVIARSGLWRRSGPGLGRRLHDLRRLAAYVRRGPDPDAAPAAPLDQAWYLAHPGQSAGLSPLAHYLAAGWTQGRAPHPLFDPQFYATRHAASLAGWRASPLEHFLRCGAARAQDPHPLFSIGWYVSRSPEVAVSGANPLTHYLDEGWRQGLSPHPLFDPEWYVRQDPQAAVGPPLVHYLTLGWRRGLSPHPLFDPAWYLERNPDVAAGGVEPLAHFAVNGGAEGRSPSPWFDTAHYVAARGEQLPAGANPLVDYLTGGAWRISEPRPGFATAAYLAARPEVAASGLTPLEHWARLADRG
jgi:hypothetical protein